jgi:hypothetical protein
MRHLISRLHNDERGHAGPIPGAIAAGAGAILLGIGAANDTGWLAITGGIIIALGVQAMALLNHALVEYEFYRRLDKLEGKK